jgi:hypothetical protein
MHTEASIRTYTGRYFDILNPQAKDVSIIDIAHALSQLCRFTGHTEEFYSVAQHSWLVSHYVPEEFALDGLLHDASEAYMTDLNRPLKHSPEMSRYRTTEKALSKVIQERFGLGPEPKEVKDVDYRMCATEMRDLMGGAVCAAKPFAFTIGYMEPRRAQDIFLKRFHELRFFCRFYRPERVRIGIDKIATVQ